MISQTWYITIWYLYLQFIAIQSSILNLNVCVGFPYYSLPFGVTSAEVYFQRQLGVPRPSVSMVFGLCSLGILPVLACWNLWIIFKDRSCSWLTWVGQTDARLHCQVDFHSQPCRPLKRLATIVSMSQTSRLHFIDACSQSKSTGLRLGEVWSKIQQLLRGFFSRLPTSSLQQRVTGSSSAPLVGVHPTI